MEEINKYVNSSYELIKIIHHKYPTYILPVKAFTFALTNISEKIEDDRILLAEILNSEITPTNLEKAISDFITYSISNITFNTTPTYVLKTILLSGKYKGRLLISSLRDCVIHGYENFVSVILENGNIPKTEKDYCLMYLLKSIEYNKGNYKFDIMVKIYNIFVKHGAELPHSKDFITIYIKIIQNNMEKVTKMFKIGILFK